MLMGMTGFGARERKVSGIGRIRVEIRSTNHKFLEIVLQLPEGFASLEERIKHEIGARLKRGRVTCAINIIGDQPLKVHINRQLLRHYISAIRSIKGQFRVKEELSTDTLVRLPGILTLVQDELPRQRVWPSLRQAILATTADLLSMRRKEGRTLGGLLKARVEALKANLEVIEKRFRKVIKEKLAAVQTDEERSSFLKDTDITEELERLSFHAKNCSRQLSQNGPAGKELDFIAQEMQREANTIGAKSCDTIISGEVIQIKSQIDKIREQVQNIE